MIEEKQSLLKLEESEREWFVGTPEVNSDWDDFNRMFARGMKDLRMLLTDLGDGPFPVAGLPIYAVPFGRDSLIAALQALPVRPEVAKGTLRILAKYQGKKVDAWKDEEPGKILHEIRFGELARSGQIPFTPYYGSIDSTPLFLVLIAEVYRWTGDLDFVREMIPYAIEALNWIDRYGDPAGTGYVSYAMRSSKGIRNQGWKIRRTRWCTGMAGWPRRRSPCRKCRVTSIWPKRRGRNCSPAGGLRAVGAAEPRSGASAGEVCPGFLDGGRAVRRPGAGRRREAGGNRHFQSGHAS